MRAAGTLTAPHRMPTRGRALLWALLAAGIVLALPCAGAEASGDAVLAAESVLEPNGRLPAVGEEGEGRFGGSLAVSADGTTALVGAPGDGGLVGAVWPFARTGSSWTQQGPKLTVPEASGEEPGLCLDEPGECGIGASVAISADGDTALVGAPRQLGERGSVWVFTRSGSTWTLRERLTAGDEERGDGRFGISVALSANGRTALVGAPRDNGQRGGVWAFRSTEAGFVHDGGELVAALGTETGFYGRAVALSADGGTALIGSPGAEGHGGSAWAYTRTAAGWPRIGTQLAASGESGAARFGSSAALSADGRTALVGGRSDAEGAGAVWVFTKGESGWSGQGGKLTPTDESGHGWFGASTAVSANGDLALIGGPRDANPLGAVWTFKREGASWSQQGAKLAAPEAGAAGSFGGRLALAANESVALVGAPRDDANAGSAWAFAGAPLPPPSVSEVDPASGPVSGGTEVTITGSGFLAGATVDIGGEASSAEVISETEIKAVTPAHEAGSEQVVVSDLYGSSQGGPAFTFVGPETAGVPSHDAVAPLQGVLASIATPAPASTPTLGVTGNLLPVSGRVRIKTPGASTFVLVGTSIQVPFGTIVDATLGKVSITTASAAGGTQTQSFYDGEFKLTQARNGTVLATLLGGSFSNCRRSTHRARRGTATAAKSKPRRKLWAEGHGGKYSTKGNYATGAALGTRWEIEDLCGGTLIRVLLHRVFVTNLVTHRHVTVSAGHSYLAKAP